MRQLRRNNRAWAECTVMLELAELSEGSVPETACETADPAETQADPPNEGTSIGRTRHGAASAGGERLIARPAWSSSFGMPVSGVRNWTVAKFRAKQRSLAEKASAAPESARSCPSSSSPLPSKSTSSPCPMRSAAPTVTERSLRLIVHLQGPQHQLRAFRELVQVCRSR